MTVGVDPIVAGYSALAPVYDALTRGYDYDRWLAEIVRVARGLGLSGRRVLDVACGTGKSFLPLLRAGYAVTGCDISRAMLDRAAAKAPGVPLHEADMRDLPTFGEHDLVTCLDDALNHLLTHAELTAALRGIRANLAPRGIAVWDVNTLATYATAFAETQVIEAGETFVVWEGKAGPVAPGMHVDVSFPRLPRAAWWLLGSLHEPAGAAALVAAGDRGRGDRGWAPGHRGRRSANRGPFRGRA